MMTRPETLNTYDTWDLQPPPLPRRSRLYCLRPIGLGTAYVESLTGYTARLAEAHRVSTGHLVVREIVPHFGRSYLPGNMTPFWQRHAPALNGTRVWARDFLQVMAQLTKRLDLHCLTFLPWADVFSSRNLLRYKRAWCQACLEQWRRTGQVIYEPLLWTLTVVTICPTHGQRLTQACAHCHKTLSWLERRTRPGYCSRCRCWLGARSDPDDRPAIDQGELKWQSWVFETVGELLAVAPTLAVFPERGHLARGLTQYIQNLNQSGQMGDVVKQLRAHNLTIDGTRLLAWLSGTNLPQLNRLLQLCYSLDVSVLRLMSPEPVDLKPLRFLEFNDAPRRNKKSSQPHNLEQLQQILEQIVTSDEEPPPSLNQVAKRLGYHEHTQLSRRLPELSRAISERYRIYRSNKSRQTKQRICQEIRQITFQLYRDAEYPSLSRVSRYLSKPGYVIDPAVKAAWTEAMAELGLQP